jgi:hypothetical protein
VEPGDSSVAEQRDDDDDDDDDDDAGEDAPLTSGDQDSSETPEAEDPSKATFMGISLRNLFLFLLLLQNSSSALLRRYSKGVLKEDYNTGTIFIISEIIKITFSIYYTVTDKSPSDAPSDSVVHKVVWLVRHSAVLLVPGRCKIYPPADSLTVCLGSSLDVLPPLSAAIYW